MSMNLEEFKEKVIKPKMHEIFGTLLGNTIVSSSYVKSMSVSGSDKDKGTFLIKSICEHPRVVGMWGNDQCNKQKAEWTRQL